MSARVCRPPPVGRHAGGKRLADSRLSSPMSMHAFGPPPFLRTSTLAAKRPSGQEHFAVRTITPAWLLWGHGRGGDGCRPRPGRPGGLMSSTHSPLLARPGAVEAAWRDEGVAAHYGDPVREQRALDGAAGLVDRSNRGVVTITGPDRLSWLHSLTTQHLEQLAPGHSTQALILSPTGQIEHPLP